MSEPLRYRDECATLRSFFDEILVHCPACGGCARSLRADDRVPVGRALRPAGMFWPRRLVCACGRAVDWAADSLAIDSGGRCDPHFGLPLWLTADVRGERLWAYNARHLDALERLVAATLRERARRPGWVRGTLLTALPTWMKRAANRAAILAAIAELKTRLPRPKPTRSVVVLR